MGVESVFIESVGLETLNILDKEFEATKIKIEYRGIESFAWVTKEGELLKEETALGWLIVKEDPEQISASFDQIGWNRPAAQYETYLKEQERGDVHVFVATVDGLFAGYVTVKWEPEYPPFAEAGIPEIQDLNVLPQHRRRGIGTALMTHARRWAWDQGLQEILAETTTKNYPALCFYQKLGFQFCGFNDHYYTNQDIALFFVQVLR